MCSDVIDEDDYRPLKDLRLEIESDDGTFSLCFWVYLVESTQFPFEILRQVHSDVPVSSSFVILNERKKLTLFPVLFSHKKAPDPGNAASPSEVPFLSADVGFPLEKWVHVGCEICPDCTRLYINGEIVGERTSSSSLRNDSDFTSLKRVTFVAADSYDNGIMGFIHYARVLPPISSIKDHYAEDPPLQLAIDSLSTSEIEEGTDGVWSIVGGKASCRRNFSLDVILSNALGQTLNKEIKVVASLLYDDNRTPVEQLHDADAPLLVSYDGMEYASCDRPSKMVQGRASFKLKISQLSSKCDNRLFRIKFEIPRVQSYPFLKTLSLPIRCISRTRNPRSSLLMMKRSYSTVHPLDGSQSSGTEDKSLDFRNDVVQEAGLLPPSKQFKLGQEKFSLMFSGESNFDPLEEEHHSHARTSNQIENMYDSNLDRSSRSLEEADNLESDSESAEERNLGSDSVASSGSEISDLVVFKYCLGGSDERAVLLMDIATSFSEDGLVQLAQWVSLFSGCSHHRRQIVIAKKMIEDGSKAWNIISQNDDHVLWDHVTSEIEEHFMMTAQCSTRSLSQQDFELMRKIAGCEEYLARENFEKLWRWLYPVGLTLSIKWINSMWASKSPKWIEGFITKEEAEFSLHGPRALQNPGTFVLRFPTSRSWPHPDAGSLVVTYVGSDYALHHRLLSIDYILSSAEDVKPLQDMLLADPELSSLGRIIRSQ